MIIRAVLASLTLLVGPILVAPAGAVPRLPRCFGMEATILATTPGVTLEGTEGPDVILIYNGAAANGNGGDDRICGDGPMTGGSGNDRLLQRGRYPTRAGSGDDIVRLRALRSAAGDPVPAYGNAGDDIMSGTGNDETLIGGQGADRLAPGPGSDRVLGDSGDDIVDAGSGDDTVNAGGGDDFVRGEGGDDRLNGGSGHDIGRGGTGKDTCTGMEETRSCSPKQDPEPSPSPSSSPSPGQ